MEKNKVKKPMLSKILVYLGLLAVVCVLPLMVTRYPLHIMTMICFYIVLASSLNLIIGYTGYPSFCHAAFYGIGAYTSALIAMRLGAPIWLSLICAVAVTALIAFAVGLPFLRISGVAFAIGTLAFGIVTVYLFTNMPSVTMGAAGLRPIPVLFSTKVPYFYLMLTFAVATVLIVYKIVNTNFGRSLIAIREDEGLAKYVGVNTTMTKVKIFTIGAMFAGLAGGILAHYLSWIAPAYFTYLPSFMAIIALLLGGIGTILGPVLGSILVVGLPEILRPVMEFRHLVFGAIIIIVILFMPMGIVGKAKQLFSKRERISG